MATTVTAPEEAADAATVAIEFASALLLSASRLRNLCKELREARALLGDEVPLVERAESRSKVPVVPRLSSLDELVGKPRRHRSWTAQSTESDDGRGRTSPIRSSLARGTQATSVVISSAELSARRKGRELEVSATGCEQRLVSLEARLAGLQKYPNPEEAAAGAALLSADCHALTKRLQQLVADALECGCDRSVPGAMDVFEQGNGLIERLTMVLSSSTKLCAAVQPQTTQASPADPSPGETGPRSESSKQRSSWFTPFIPSVLRSR